MSIPSLPPRGRPTVEIPGTAGVLAGNALTIPTVVAPKTGDIGRKSSHCVVNVGEDAGWSQMRLSQKNETVRYQRAPATHFRK